MERLLKKARLAEPSAEFKARITRAAKEAWNEPPVEMPWRIGLRRLAVSAAAAVLMISSANYYSIWSVARWQAGPPSWSPHRSHFVAFMIGRDRKSVV